MRLVTTHQHRSVAVVPGTAAGSFKMLVLERDLVNLYLAEMPCSEFVRVALGETASRYRAAYRATGLEQALGTCHGYITAGVPLSAMERMSEKEMRTWRTWCLWRSVMSKEEALVVDDVVIYDMRIKRPALLRSGLLELARAACLISPNRAHKRHGLP